MLLKENLKKKVKEYKFLMQPVEVQWLFVSEINARIFLNNNWMIKVKEITTILEVKHFKYTIILNINKTKGICIIRLSNISNVSNDFCTKGKNFKH